MQDRSAITHRAGTSTVWISPTCNAIGVTVTKSSNTPASPVDAVQDVVHTSVTDAAYRSPGWSLEYQAYVYPHGAANLSPYERSHPTPRPGHERRSPLPKSHTVDDGDAVAVTEIPGNPTVAETGPGFATDNHVSTFTTLRSAGGDNTAAGTGSSSRKRAVATRARSCGGSTGTHAPCTTPPHERTYKFIGTPPGPGGPDPNTPDVSRAHGVHELVPTGGATPPPLALITHATICAGACVASPPAPPADADGGHSIVEAAAPKAASITALAHTCSPPRPCWSR